MAAGQADGVLDVGGGDAGRRRDDRGGVFAAGAVEAEQGVEVDGAAGLVLGGLAVRHADRRQVFTGPGDAAAGGKLNQVTFDVLFGAPPQFPGGGIPDDVGGVVVAVHAQRLAEAGIAGRVPPVAGQGAAVRAGPGAAAGVAGLGFAVAVLLADTCVAADGPGVDRAEGGGSEGGEHHRVGGHRLGDALPACQSRADQVEGVAPVDLSAAGAGRRAAVTAGLVDHLVGQVIGADRAGDLAGGRVDVADGTAQQDGPGAGGGGPDVRQPGVIGIQPD